MRFFICPPLLCFGQIVFYCLYWANACVFWEGMHYNGFVWFSHSGVLDVSCYLKNNIILFDNHGLCVK